jgi:hypothetical protein
MFLVLAGCWGVKTVEDANNQTIAGIATGWSGRDVRGNRRQVIKSPGC